MSDSNSIATESDVVNCYRVFLGREPESQEVVQGMLAAKPGVWDLVRSFIGSSESAERSFLEVGHRLSHGAYVNSVDVTGTPDQIEQLFKHVRQTWAQFGEEEPYWSVLVAPEFRSAVMNATSEEVFYRSGRGDCDRFATVCARNEVAQPTGGTVLDFGCGVGRLGEHLSHDFAHYVGIDISAPHLAVASRRMQAIGRTNCAFDLLPDFLASGSGYDAFMSLIVLQHNPPPVMDYLLNVLLRRLNPGGIAYFQVPCFLFNYSFKLVDYLALIGGRTMEMHALPQRAVFRAIAANSCRLLEMTMDGLIGKDGLSYTFLVQKA